jgi:uncharacterized phage protein (TIGR02218 family)
MRVASAATLAALAAGQTKRVDLYAITLAGATPTYYFTSAQMPVTALGQLWQTGLVIKRGPIKQSIGLTVDTMDVSFSVQQNNSTGTPVIAGRTFLKAAADRVFDGGRLFFRKMFLTDFNDTTPGAVDWFQGRINKVQMGRLTCQMSINSDAEMLNVQMPPNLVQKTCNHVFCDPGCGLSLASYTDTGAVASVSTILNIESNLIKPEKYYSLGRLTFLTGVNATNPRTTYYVKYSSAAGEIQLIRPLPGVPAIGDTFQVSAGCPHTLAACSNTNAAVGPVLNNRGRFKGEPFVPVPETLYDGGSALPAAAPSLGSQGGGSTGSPFSSGVGTRNVFKA